jgi:hypothetical protein
MSQRCRELGLGDDASGVVTQQPLRRWKEPVVKFVILIHSNPRPWGHPTGDYVTENLALP